MAYLLYKEFAPSCKDYLVNPQSHPEAHLRRMPRKRRNRTEVCFWEWAKGIFFQIQCPERYGHAPGRSLVEGPWQSVYVLANGTQDTRSGGAPEKGLPGLLFLQMTDPGPARGWGRGRAGGHRHGSYLMPRRRAAVIPASPRPLWIEKIESMSIP